MCVVSMIGDHFNERYKPLPWIYPPEKSDGDYKIDLTLISKTEFDALKLEVELLKELLHKALAYDKANNEPHCEKPEKIKLLKDIAKALGVEIKID
jgi:hypothetical protein